jgi:hypothetical protein
MPTRVYILLRGALEHLRERGPQLIQTSDLVLGSLLGWVGVFLIQEMGNIPPPLLSCFTVDE